MSCTCVSKHYVSFKLLVFVGPDVRPSQLHHPQSLPQLSGVRLAFHALKHSLLQTCLSQPCKGSVPTPSISLDYFEVVLWFNSVRTLAIYYWSYLCSTAGIKKYNPYFHIKLSKKFSMFWLHYNFPLHIRPFGSRLHFPRILSNPRTDQYASVIWSSNRESNLSPILRLRLLSSSKHRALNHQYKIVSLF